MSAYRIPVSASAFDLIKQAADARRITMGELVAEVVDAAERERIEHRADMAALANRECERAWPKARVA